MNESSRLNRVLRALVLHEAGRYAAKFVINPRRQLFQSCPIAACPSAKKLRGLRALRVGHTSAFPSDYSPPGNILGPLSSFRGDFAPVRQAGKVRHRCGIRCGAAAAEI
ncbi:MAG TPA: hypothetical protein VKB88_42280 [Bryobacteraceae bacterium]|nr:hypothetical protein [Bryobacteraceae bacterium]